MKIVIAIAVFIACMGASYEFGAHHQKTADDLAETKSINAAVAEALEQSTANRTAEQKAAAIDAASDKQHLKELTDAQAQASRDIDSLRSDNLRLRHPAGSACAAGGAAASSAAIGSSDAGTAAFVSREDQEALLRIGAEADEVVLQLQDCQRKVLADQALCK